MAQRVNVVLVDDIDGADAAETVSFALDGVDYEIDLSDKHASELRNAFSLYVGHARRTGGRRKSGRRASSAPAADGSVTAWVCATSSTFLAAPIGGVRRSVTATPPE